MADGYIRQSAGDIVDGNTITAAQHNNEYNAIQAFASATTGHNHDSTTGGGAPIPPAGLVGLSANGLVARVDSTTFAGRTLTAPAAGITVTNGNGVSGNPTLVLANDLAGLEGLATNGVAVRTGTSTWTTRTLTGTANEITITNGDGIAAAPTFSIPNAVTFTGKTVTGGTFAAPTLTGTITATAATANMGVVTSTVSGTDVGITVTNTGTGNTAVFNAGAANQTITIDNAGLLQVGMTGGTAKVNIKALSNGTTDYPVYLENAAGTGSTQFGVYGFTTTVGYTANYATYDLQTAGVTRISVAAGGITTFVSAAYGYGTGTGGTVTQITSKATGVTLNKQCGQITMNAASLAANTAVAFVLTNSTISSGDIVDVMVQGGAAASTSYIAYAYGAGAGTVTIVLRNLTAGALLEAVVLTFNVRKSVTA